MGAATQRPSERRNQGQGFYSDQSGQQAAPARQPASAPQTVTIPGYGDREFNIEGMSWRRGTRHQDGSIRYRGGLVDVTDNGQQRILGRIDRKGPDGQIQSTYELLRPHSQWDEKLGGADVLEHNREIQSNARKDRAQRKTEEWNERKLEIQEEDSRVNRWAQQQNVQLKEFDSASAAYDAHANRHLRAQEANNQNIINTNSQNIQIARDNRAAAESQARIALDAIRTADQRRADSRNTLLQILALQNSQQQSQQQMKLSLLGDLMKMFGG